MEQEKPIEWPYYFCSQCSKLSPVQVMGGTKFCLKCTSTLENPEAGKVVLLSQKEARMRKLSVIKDEVTGELEDE